MRKARWCRHQIRWKKIDDILNLSSARLSIDYRLHCVALLVLIEWTCQRKLNQSLNSSILNNCRIVWVRWLWLMVNFLSIHNNNPLIDDFFPPCKFHSKKILTVSRFHSLLLLRLECLQKFPPSINSFNHNCGNYGCETQFCFWIEFAWGKWIYRLL